MKPITLRDIPEHLAERIREEAEQYGTSLNRTVINMLNRSIDEKQKDPRIGHGLDRYFGVWTEEEADEFDALLKEQRVIDKEFWK
nr:hypothetical protein Hi04_10k_c2089_00004 [uncultured bacterium]